MWKEVKYKILVNKYAHIFVITTQHDTFLPSVRCILFSIPLCKTNEVTKLGILM